MSLDYDNTMGCDKEAVIAFLEKLKAQMGSLITCEYKNEDGTTCDDPAVATAVCLTIAGKDPIVIKLNTVCQVQVGMDDDGNPIYAPFEDGVADISQCCPIAPIEVPPSAFADPANPTQSEVNTWIVSNHPDAPANTLFYYGFDESGSPDDPDWVWAYDGDGNTINVDEPKCCVDVVHVQIPPGTEDGAAWIAENYPDGLPQGTHVYTGASPLTPTQVWAADANGDLVCVKEPSDSPDAPHVMVPEGEDPAVWIAANAADYPAGTHFYTGTDPLAPEGVWVVDSDGVILCDKDPAAASPVHVMVPEGEDPATWIAANYADYPADSHFYTGADPLAPEGVWNVDADGNILCDKRPEEASPVHVMVPEGEDPATWIAANYADYPADSHFYTGTDPLAPEGVWNVDADGNILCDKAPSPVNIMIPANEDPATWIAANAADYPPGSHFYTGTDPLAPEGVWNIGADGVILCDKTPPAPPIEIPAEAFADPLAPTTAEVNTWMAANYPNSPPDQDFWYGGTQDDPTYVWTADGDGTAHCIKEPAKQTMYCSGNKIPADYAGDPIPYTYWDPTSESYFTASLVAGSTIPSLNFDESPEGKPCVHIDPVTGVASCVATNPFVTANCVDGAMQMLRCDGSGMCWNTVTRRVGGSGAAGSQLSPATENGPIPSTLGCVPIHLPKCPVVNMVRFIMTTGYQMKGAFQMGANSQFRPEVSLDGGATWISMGSGGIDSLAQVSASDDGFSGPEHEFFDEISLPINTDVSGQDLEICFRVNFLNGTVGGGTLQVNRPTFTVLWNETECCPIASPLDPVEG